ncbi:BsuPI-related putative proteinase inhibitor [Bacillus sp. FJAT-27445]|uniref:BsuPI-related putative proteinase inhibitor n=1 Tax=Bacillus sp. FJAT-27445 TaxID=1679166 RepID=UPI0007443318|nr:BsuPI-related putative proteinase inhibitor [Bacillus sp. FJAT-27445]
MKLTIASWLLLSVWLPFAQNGQGKPDGLQLNIQVEPGPEQAAILLQLKNKGSETAQLQFPTSQYYEIYVLDENGGEVFLYSKGRAFLQALQTVTVPGGGTKVWKETWPYSSDGIRVPEGNYKVVATVLPTSVDGKAPNPANLSAETTVTVPAGGLEGDRASEPGEQTIFTEVKTEGTNGSYKVTGKARPRSGEFFYTVEDGHSQLVPETKVPSGKAYPEWGQFEVKINIPPGKLPKNGVLILNLYEKKGSSISGEPMAVILEQFRGKE